MEADPQVTCTLFNTLAFLFISTEKVRELLTDPTTNDLAKNSAAVQKLISCYKNMLNPKDKKVLFSSDMFPFKFPSSKKFQVENFTEFLSEVQFQLNSALIDQLGSEASGDKDAGESAAPTMSAIVELMLTEGMEALGELEREHYLFYLSHILYSAYRQFFPDAPTISEETGEELVLGEKAEIITNNLEEFKAAIDQRPLDNPLSHELFRSLIHGIDLSYNSDPFSERLLRLYGKFYKAQLADNSAGALEERKKFIRLDVPNAIRIDAFNWSSSVSLAVQKFQTPFVQERATFGVEFLIPNSLFVSMQKVRVMKEFAFRALTVPENIPEDKQTPFDRLQYPNIREFLIKLRTDVDYVTEDYDWKALFFDFNLDTFLSFPIQTLTSELPDTLAENVFMFSSHHIGWANADTLTIPIVTSTQPKSLSTYLHNITLFVAPNPNTPLEYLLEFIRQSVNVALTDDCGPDEDQTQHEISQIHSNLFFRKKMSSASIPASQFGLHTKLSDVIQTVNPGRRIGSKKVHFIVHLRHKKQPLFSNYRTKTRVLTASGKPPSEMSVESIKPTPNSMINHLLRWGFDGKIETVDGRSLLAGRHIGSLLPQYIFLDTRVVGEMLFDPKTGIDYTYFNWLMRELNYQLAGNYKPKGLVIFDRIRKEYYPLIVRPDPTKGRSLETGRVQDVLLDDYSDSSVHFLYLQKAVA